MRKETLKLLVFQCHTLEHLLGIERKVALKHPSQIARVAEEDFLGCPALILAEVDDFHIVLVVNHASSKIHVAIHGREFSQKLHVVLQVVRIPVELCLKHFEGGTRVGIGGVSILKVSVAIELIGSRECATLQLVIDILHIHEMALGEVDIDANPKEFLHQQRHIELVAVEPREVAALESLLQFIGYLPEAGTVMFISRLILSDKQSVVYLMIIFS